jgi:hypothetical protein
VKPGLWILLLLAGIVGLFRPLAGLLPGGGTLRGGYMGQDETLGQGLPVGRFLATVLVPAVVVPLVGVLVYRPFLPVLVADYLAVHFFVYGALVFCWILWQRRGAKSGVTSWSAFAVSLAAVVGFGFVALVWPLDSFVTSFVPTGSRPMLIAILLVGTLAFFLTDEWMTRGTGAARGGYVASKLAFLVSLAMAVALDPGRLFFLIIIVPVIGLFFLVYGLLSRWIYGSTGNPLIAGLASAIAFAWAIGVTFPLVAG